MANILGIGKILTLLVLITIFYNRDLLSRIPDAWQPILGGICVATACVSLFLVAYGFARVLFGAAFWLLSAFLISGAFFPDLYLLIKNNKVTQLVTKSDALNRNSKNKYRNVYSSEEMFCDTGIGDRKSSNFELRNLYTSVVESSWLKGQSSNAFNISPPFGEIKNAIPENAYFRAPKVEISMLTNESTLKNIKSWLNGARKMKKE